MSTDLQWEVLKVLATSKRPMRAQHIARAVNKDQSNVDYNLKKMVADGRILLIEADGVKTYKAQKLISSAKIRNNFKIVFLDSMPELLENLDLSKAEDPVKAYIQAISDLLCLTASDLKKEMDSLKKDT